MNPTQGLPNGAPSHPPPGLLASHRPGGFGQALGPMIERRIADGTLRLPTPPSSATRVMELLRREELDARSVARALEKEPILATQVMRLANSVANRGSVKVTNLSQAVVALGARQLKSFLITAVAVQLFVSKDRELELVMKQLRAHSVAVSVLCRDLAHLTGCPEVEESYLAGLLHDIGKVVILVFVLELLKEQRPARQAVRVRVEDCQEAWERLHRKLAIRLFAEWGLPGFLAEVVQESASYKLNERVCPANLVCFANAMAKKMRIYPGEAPPHEVHATIMIGRSVLGIDEDVVERLCTGLEDRVKDL
ncbi:MAG: HDOD domain-containing protein [Deltaproteobacteria bacterium]|nr:HDOD domain-containing protein [Deltaproteobacteria bacterium]